MRVLPVRDRITSRLQNTSPPEDPVASALATLPAEVVRSWFPDRLKTAAVLVPLVPRSQGLSILLTRRTETVKDHPGQISFPGGRVEAGDLGPADTALRETAEEIGLEPERITVVGYLDAYPVVTGYAVVPVVGFIEADVPLTLDPTEVAEAFEVPLDFLMDAANVRQHRRSRDGVELLTFEYHYAGHRIWGATAHMIKKFIDLIA